MTAKNESQVQMVVTVNEEISRAVLELEQQRTHLQVAHISNVVYGRLDAKRVAPHVVQFLSIQDLKQRVMAFLRTRYDPEARARAAIDEGQDDLFGSTLQSYYPVKREVMGQTDRLYVPRDDLTTDEVEIIAARLRRVGAALYKHSDALLAWNKSR